MMCCVHPHEYDSHVVVLQGSYGVVKLAYNEDDDKNYVSQSSRITFQLLSEDPVKGGRSATQPPLSFVFSIHSLCIYCLDRAALQDPTRPIDFSLSPSTSLLGSASHPLTLHQSQQKKCGKESDFLLHWRSIYDFTFMKSVFLLLWGQFMWERSCGRFHRGDPFPIKALRPQPLCTKADLCFNITELCPVQLPWKCLDDSCTIKM